MKHTRRQFLQTTTSLSAVAVASPFIVPSSVFGDDTKAAPSNRITVGHIGVGGLGSDQFRKLQQNKNAQSVAVADCYKSRREGAAAACKGKAYLDFREILARNDVDAVTIDTVDHWHVPIAAAAAKANKHVLVAKPLGLTIEQNLTLQKIFAATKLVFQYGTQQRAIPHCRLLCALARKGVIGKITAIEVDAPNGGKGGTTAEAPIPDDLGAAGYEMWLGPAPKVPYTAGRCRPQGTYWIYDQSIGYLGGWGAHPLDMMVWGSDADLSGPIVVEGTGDVPTEGLYDTVFNWDMKIKLGNVDFTFKTGSDRTRFIGEGGWLQVRRQGIEASNPDLLKTPIDVEEVLGLPKRENIVNEFAGGNIRWAAQSVSMGTHSADWIAAIQTGTPTASPLKDAVRSDNISHLCDIAVRTKSVVKWDPIKFQLVDGTPEQTKMLSRPMREPWTI